MDFPNKDLPSNGLEHELSINNVNFAVNLRECWVGTIWRCTFAFHHAYSIFSDSAYIYIPRRISTTLRPSKFTTNSNAFLRNCLEVVFCSNVTTCSNVALSYITITIAISLECYITYNFDVIII